MYWNTKLLCGAGLLLGVHQGQAKRPTEPPNLVFVFSDQQAFDMLGCYGNDQIVTPNLDRFAQQGVRFTHCFSNCPISTPYRGMLMTGQHSLYNGTFVNDKPVVPGHGKKFVEVLRDAGYATAYVGKWHLLGGDRDRPVPVGEMRYGFDELFLTNNCHVNFNKGACFYWNDDGEKVFFDDWEVSGQTEQAIAYLDSRKYDDRPFALFVSWHPPHDWGKFKDEDGKMHYRYDAPQELMAYYDRDSIRMRPGVENTPDRRRMYHGHMAMATGVDLAFGRLMDKLKEMGVEENTLVVFTSDHGDMLEFSGAELPKQYPHDYSSRVPLILRMPGVLAEGDSSALLVGAMDLMPTVLGLMGLDIPKQCQGHDLSRAMISGDEDAVDYIPIWLYVGEGFRGVIPRDFTFSTQPDGGSASLHNVLFDRNTDPCQLHNLYEDPAYAGKKEELVGLTRKWMKKYGDRFWNYNDFMQAATDDQWNENRSDRPIDIMRRYDKKRGKTNNMNKK